MGEGHQSGAAQSVRGIGQGLTHVTDQRVIAVGREPDSARLAAVEACREVIHRSFALADAGRRAEIADLFVADGVQSIDGEIVRGREEIRKMFAARDKAGRRTAHSVTTMTFDVASAAEIGARTMVLLYLPSDINPTTPTALTTVEDMLVKDGDAWRLSNRVTIVLSRRG